MGNEQLDFIVNESWQNVAESRPWLAFIPETSRGSDNELFMRRKGGSVIYRAISEENPKDIPYECVGCDGSIRAAIVAHSIHDGPFRGSGFGNVSYENVPYCPNCEERPSYSGSPIAVGPYVN